MKKLYSVRNEGVWRLTSVALTLITLFTYCNSMRADYNFYANGMHSLKIDCSDDTRSYSYNDYICGNSGCDRNTESLYEAGAVKTFKIKNFWVKSSRDSKSNVCGARIVYYVHGVTGEHDFYTNHGENDGDAYHQKWSISSDTDILIVSDANNPLINFNSQTPGQYYFKYYYQLNCGDGTDCSKRYSSNSNGGATNTVSFIIPGFVGSSQSITELNFSQMSQGHESAARTVTLKHYGKALTQANCAITNLAGNAVDYFTVSSISETSVSVKFTPKNTTPVGNVTAYLNITDAYGKTAKTVTLNGKVSQGTTVLVGNEAESKDGPSVILDGYLQYGECSNKYTSYGFYYSSEGCSSVESSGSYVEKSGNAKYGGDSWKDQIATGLSYNTDYWYKPYVKAEDTGTKVFSASCGKFRTKGACSFPAGDTIYYHIDPSFEFEDLCELKFKTLEDALNDLESHTGNNEDDWWDAVSRMLKTNVVFEVASGEYGEENGIMQFKSINDLSSSRTPSKRLVIRGASRSEMPTLYGMDLSYSRWITLKNLLIKRSTTGTGLSESAVIIGFADQSNNRTVGELTSTEIEFINCDIDAQAFCCIHGNGVDGLYMTGCNLIAKKNPNSEDPKNDLNWGSSIKLMNSKNVRLVRNNFRGSHGTNIFFQNSNSALIMNNAFWNENEIKRNDDETWNYKAFIRLINYNANDDAHKISNVGIYYNTMYLKQNAGSGYNDNTDFLVLGGQADKNTEGKTPQSHIAAYYDFNTIEFMYNNCYSYDSDIQGRTSDAFCNQNITSSTHITHNNFWSEYDKNAGSSGFAFGNDTRHINVQDQVCVTAPDTPDGLVIKNNGLNLGSKVTSDVASLFSADTVRSDRLHYAVRPESNKWTYGAYQQGESSVVEKIFWKGGADGAENDWDNRNNWLKENGELLTCVDELSPDLTVVIPAKEGSKVTPRKYTVSHYPNIDVWEDPEISEVVRAGISEETYSDVTLYAKNIEIEYGGALLGIENLRQSDIAGNPIYRYSSATSHLTANKREWILVGTVIRPFDNPEIENDSTTRVVRSGDFYLNAEPQVYMQEVTTKPVGNSTSIVWGVPFSDMYTSVPTDKCFAIMVANQYGPKKRTAKMYYKSGDPRRETGEDPVTYNFTGHFAGDFFDGKPVYNFAAGYNFVNNLYPANVKASAFYVANVNAVKVYSYPNDASDIASAHGWDDYANIDVNYEIKPQNGFVVVAASANSVQLDDDDFTENKTTYRRAAEMTGVSVAATNVAVSKGSRVGVWLDYSSIEKAENANDNEVCEVYIPFNDKSLSTLSVSSLSTEVPLGIHNKMSRNMTVRFELTQSPGVESVVLEDRLASPVRSYDLLAGENAYFDGIEPGYTEGRFFLVLNGGSDEGGSDITRVDEDVDDESSINIYVNSNILSVSASAEQSIEVIELSDMAGRTWQLKPSGKNYSTHILNVETGTYIVRVTTDRGSVCQKIMVKK